MDGVYDYRNCSSLFGYAAQVHARSGGVCQLCGAGSSQIDFDLWRQLTVEHLIGEGQGGYPRAIKVAVEARFPDLSVEDRLAIEKEIDNANTVTACSFCNSTTSRTRFRLNMGDLLLQVPGDAGQVLAHVRIVLAEVLGSKREMVAWKLDSVRRAYFEMVQPELRARRSTPPPAGS
ncbi:MAG: hypothetical protein ACRDHY_12070 [Anaerolineales bacterium]